MKSREYYTEFAEKLPKDTVILTAGCAKYRYNKLNLGDIGGIPRVLDAGQCNDSYSLVVIAQKLAEAFALNSVNELPLAFNIAWYEQKAVIVLLALLSLGVKNIHLGPTLPVFFRRTWRRCWWTTLVSLALERPRTICRFSFPETDHKSASPAEPAGDARASRQGLQSQQVQADFIREDALDGVRKDLYKISAVAPITPLERCPPYVWP
jgi:hypothetical protein